MITSQKSYAIPRYSNYHLMHERNPNVLKRLMKMNIKMYLISWDLKISGSNARCIANLPLCSLPMQVTKPCTHYEGYKATKKYNDVISYLKGLWFSGSLEYSVHWLIRDLKQCAKPSNCQCSKIPPYYRIIWKRPPDIYYFSMGILGWPTIILLH